jgi:hypothetical protein
MGSSLIQAFGIGSYTHFCNVGVHSHTVLYSMQMQVSLDLHSKQAKRYILYLSI